MKEDVFKNLAKFTGQHLCQRLFFIKIAGKKSLWHRSFPVNFAKFLRTPFLQINSGRLLLNHVKVSFDVVNMFPNIE